MLIKPDIAIAAVFEYIVQAVIEQLFLCIQAVGGANPALMPDLQPTASERAAKIMHPEGLDQQFQVDFNPDDAVASLLQASLDQMTQAGADTNQNLIGTMQVQAFQLTIGFLLNGMPAMQPYIVLLRGCLTISTCFDGVQQGRDCAELRIVL